MTALVLLPQLDNYVVSSIDYQSELIAVWSERVKTDTSGILEKTITHSWGCTCCTQDPLYLNRKRNYYKRKTRRRDNFKHEKEAAS
jgi:hypothetical protein